MLTRTKYWTPLDDGRVQCDVCPRHCRMHEGQRGLCYVRGVQNGEVVLTSYGNASGFCVDPIEKKPLNHFLPGTPVLSFGQFGCNLTCSYCQNWSISKAKRDNPTAHGIHMLSRDPGYESLFDEPEPVHKMLYDMKGVNQGSHFGKSNKNNGVSGSDARFTPGSHLNKHAKNPSNSSRLPGCKDSQNHDISKSRAFDKLQSEAAPDAIVQAALKTGARSVAYTYNDPVIFLEYAVDVAVACREKGVKNVAVSAGYICDEPRVEFYRHMDAANIDLKAFTQEFYRKLCSADLQPILETLMYLKHETDVWFEITDLLIPDENDSEHEIEEMTQWVVENLGPDVPMHFTAFHPDWKMLDKPRTPPETLLRARAIAKKNGVRYAYTGNVHHKATQSTYCHNCGEMLIGRDWYVLSEWGVDFSGNHVADCRKCGTHLAGVFEDRPGDWGSKRMPVRFRHAAQTRKP